MGFLFSLASGKNLDVRAQDRGLKRKRWLMFRESDRSYKARILEAHMINEGMLESLT
jgi:hypothetical protein